MTEPPVTVYRHDYDHEICDDPGDRADDEHVCGHGWKVHESYDTEG